MFQSSSENHIQGKGTKAAKIFALATIARLDSSHNHNPGTDIIVEGKESRN